MWPTREELRQIGHSIWEHARLKWPEGEEAKKYNVVQKLTYSDRSPGAVPAG
jgi:hypothetical protein